MEFSKYQKFVLAVLAFLQFTVILDFMILSPLGAILMPSLNITPSQFGLVVSAYAFSAGISGVLAAGFADRFDRKKILLFFYSGFLLGTLLCSLAPNFPFLLMARMVTGVFGGVITSIVFAITTDLFPFEMRGRVMGIVQTAFSASQILGIPFALFLAGHWGWHFPFLFIVGVGLTAGFIILVYLRPIDSHLQMRQDRNPWGHLSHTLSNPSYLHAFATTALLSTGGFMLMPFSSAFMVNNLKISMVNLPYIYLFSGIVSMLTGPIIGRMSDRVGKFKIFVFGSALTMIMVFIYTHLRAVPLPVVMLVSAVLFIGVSSRMITSQALMSAIPSPESRGAFMSISSSVQQISGGIASVIAGLIVIQQPSGFLDHFDWLGYCVIGSVSLGLYFMYLVHQRVPE